MIGGCLTSGKYNMTADLFRKTGVQNANTGQVKATYIIEEAEFSLIARGLSNLRGKDSGTLQDYGNRLDDYHYLRIKTTTYMEEGDLVTNILDSQGQPYLKPDMQFIILGVTPTFDPFGEFLEYDIIANKSDVYVKLPTVMSSSDSLSVTGADA